MITLIYVLLQSLLFVYNVVLYWTNRVLTAFGCMSGPWLYVRRNICVFWCLIYSILTIVYFCHHLGASRVVWYWTVLKWDRTISVTRSVYSKSTQDHDDVMTRNCFPRLWIRWWPVDSPHNGLLMRTCHVFVSVIIDNMLHKQYSCRWFVVPWRSCGVIVMSPGTFEKVYN